jgi:hypothetical protein
MGRAGGLSPGVDRRQAPPTRRSCPAQCGGRRGRKRPEHNQVIGPRHYLTQEEFSNRNFARNGGGCLQSE